MLLNGRRVVQSGTGADDSVDFGTIPLSMIERIEVLKDGASAIYGSDAIAGVVNVITRTNVSGTEANIYTSTATNTLDSGTPALREHAVFSQAATGGGTMLDRSLFAAINLDGTVGDGLQSAYSLTLTSGG